MNPIARKVDHVFVPVADPAPLFELFTGPLGLPVAWADHDYGTFRSSGVCLGNANIEFVAGDPTVMSFFAPTEPLTVRGIAFEPAEPERTVPSLDERKLRHTPPFPFQEPGVETPLWTNVFLAGMVGDAAVAFFCDYHEDSSLRGDAAREALHECGGGTLGVRGLSEITLGVADIEKAEERWRRLLAPLEPDRHGAFRFEDGPAVRLRKSPMDVVAGMWLEVESLEKAREVLLDLDLLGPTRASGVGLDYAHTGGLDVWLAERR